MEVWRFDGEKMKIFLSVSIFSVEGESPLRYLTRGRVMRGEGFEKRRRNEKFIRERRKANFYGNRLALPG